VERISRLSRPQLGSDCYWVVRTGGTAEAEAVGAAVTSLLRAGAQAQEVLAYNPAMRGDEPGVMGRVPPDCARMLRDMPVHGRAVHVRGQRMPIQPHTAIGQRGHSLRAARAPAAEHHRILWQGRGAPGGDAAIVASTVPADGLGNPTGVEETVSVLLAAPTPPTREGTDAQEWTKLPGTVRYVHPFAGAVCSIRAVPLGDCPVLPAAAVDAFVVAAPTRQSEWQAQAPGQSIELEVPPGGAMYGVVQSGGRMEIVGAGESARIAIPRASAVGIHNPAMPSCAAPRWSAPHPSGFTPRG